MAITFDSTTDRVAFTSGSNFPQTGSLAMWFKPTWASTDGVGHVFFEMLENASPTMVRLEKTSTNILLLGWYWGGVGDFRLSVASGSYTINQNAWNHLVLTWDDTANETRGYLNGTLIGTPTTTLQAFTSNRTRYIGNYDAASGNFNFAEFAVWSAVLSTSDVSALNKSVSPALVRTDALEDYLPLLRDAVNITGAAPTFTNTAVAVHPRMIYRPTVAKIRYSATVGIDAAPVTFTPAVVGASTFSAALVQFLLPAVVGASTVTAAVTTPALFTASVVGASTVGAAISSVPYLAPVVVGASTVTAGVSSRPLLSASVVSASTVTASVISTPLLSATVVAASSLTANVSSTPRFTVTVVADSIVDVSMGGPALLHPSIIGASTVSIGLTTRPLLSASVVGASTASVILTTPARLTAAVVSDTLMTVTLSTPARLAATIAGASTVTVALSTPGVAQFTVTVLGTSTVTAAVTTFVPWLVVKQPTGVLLVSDGQRCSVLTNNGKRGVRLVDPGWRSARVIANGQREVELVADSRRVAEVVS